MITLSQILNSGFWRKGLKMFGALKKAAKTAGGLVVDAAKEAGEQTIKGATMGVVNLHKDDIDELVTFVNEVKYCIDPLMEVPERQRRMEKKLDEILEILKNPN